LLLLAAVAAADRLAAAAVLAVCYLERLMLTTQRLFL
jgi:hypothetical protein